jgi:hypothetical protein
MVMVLMKTHPLHLGRVGGDEMPSIPHRQRQWSSRILPLSKKKRTFALA